MSSPSPNHKTTAPTLPRGVLWVIPILLLSSLGALYYMGLGEYGLFDPWETHYGEVARDMVERDNYIDPFWGAPWDSGDVKRERAGFYSKPPLTMWMMAAGMKTFGVNAWGVRLLFPLFALCALLSVYLTLTRLKGVAAGVLATLCTALTPSFGFLSHQAVTDGPLVSVVILGMMALTLAVATPREERATPLLRGVVIVIIAAMIIGQLWVIWPMDRSPDAFRASPHSGLWWRAQWWLRELWIVGRGKGWVIALTLTPLCLGYLYSLLKIRRAREIYFLAFFAFCGLTVPAKGWLGWAPMGGALIGYLAISGSWRLLTWRRVRLGLITVFFTGHIWVLAMLGGHHPHWMRRFIYHDHINRLFRGVHSTDSGHFEYFFQWLGYGLYPLIALAPLALTYALERWRVRSQSSSQSSSQNLSQGALTQLQLDSSREAERDVSSDVSSDVPQGRGSADPLLLMTSLWALVGFTLFSYSRTKFHHYIFPVLPALTILIGVALAQVWRGALRPRKWSVLAALFTLLWVGGDLMRPAHAPGQGAQHWVNLFTYKYDRDWPLTSTPKEIEKQEEEVASSAWRTQLTLPVTRSQLAARDLKLAQDYRDEAQNNDRLIIPVRWWSLLALIGLLFLTLRGLTGRRIGVIALTLSATWASCFSLHVYLPTVAPHWSQWELWREYYQRCDTYSADEADAFRAHMLRFSSRVPAKLEALPAWCRNPVIAFRMNWRGEALYTHNTAVPALYTKDLKPILQNWGVWDEWRPGKRFFIFTERGRVKSELERSLPAHLKGKYREVFGEGRRFVLLEVDLDAQSR